jgi:predicted transcriptional regulator
MKISNAESRVMDVLWKEGRPITSEEAALALADDQEWAHGTVRSLLTRLVRKKAVAARMEGRRYLYSPLIARAAYAQAESEHLLQRLFDGRLAPFITQFTQRQDLSQDELAELRRLIDRLDRDR